MEGTRNLGRMCVPTEKRRGGKERRGNMAESWLGPSPSPSLCLTLNLPQFPCSRSHSMSTLRSQNPNNCRCSSSSTLIPSPARPSLLVFSGGTAFNGVVEELKNFTTRVAHVLPVSDDGGSTAEIVRVLGT